jgi:hypothetical protein
MKCHLCEAEATKGSKNHSYCERCFKLVIEDRVEDNSDCTFC